MYYCAISGAFPDTKKVAGKCTISSFKAGGDLSQHVMVEFIVDKINQTYRGSHINGKLLLSTIQSLNAQGLNDTMKTDGVISFKFRGCLGFPVFWSAYSQSEDMARLCQIHPFAESGLNSIMLKTSTVGFIIIGDYMDIWQLIYLPVRLR
jgi:hypothetical protein